MKNLRPWMSSQPILENFDILINPNGTLSYKFPTYVSAIFDSYPNVCIYHSELKHFSSTILLFRSGTFWRLHTLTLSVGGTC